MPALNTPTPIYRKDYCPSTFLVESVELHFELDAVASTVRSQLHLRRNPQAPPDAPLRLEGRDLELLEMRLDGQVISESRYQREVTHLTLSGLADSAHLEIVTRVHPSANTALEGLYQSGQILCTQCEAHGFSRITYFPDRPDVMTRYRVTLSANRNRYPVLLANGNPIASGEGEGGRHWVTWEDPFPKPCYLFALVAGELALIEDEFITQSGRRVALRIYVESQNRERCGHAMTSLKQAMRWDEEVFGREYDLDIFMIVAVGSFNMGAMENKGLNIFNAKYIVADSQTATDDDFDAVRDIIGHEYFHNWTGNRITCRDWFQLSVKESLTVFREQLFSAAMGSAAITRIRQARLIRTQQFPEDAGPMAHPVRPDSYLEVNNLYTLTVYEKGAEVIRMLHTLLGAKGFRRAMDLYFERHDGQAVTVEDFLKAMEDASEHDLSQFRLWYSQAGTPVIRPQLKYDAATRHHVLRLEQSIPATPGQPSKLPMHIPLRMALLDESGTLHRENLIELRKANEEFVFDGLPGACTLSLVRDFSAPVRLIDDVDERQMRRLALHSADAFSRWDAVQQLFLRELMRRVERVLRKEPVSPADELVQTLQGLLADTPTDPALMAEMLQMPSESYLAEQYERADIDAIVTARDDLRREITNCLHSQLMCVYDQCTDGAAYQPDAQSIARRRLRSLCLSWLLATDTVEVRKLAQAQYHAADNMTDVQAALSALNDSTGPERTEAMAHFRKRWQDHPLVLDKWFGLQAVTRLPDSYGRVSDLLSDPSFDIRNPNRVRAVLGVFAFQNLRGFHRRDGAGYTLIADQVRRLDGLNPQVAARLTSAFTRWRRFDDVRSKLMRSELEKLRASHGLSLDSLEIVSKSLEPG